MGQGANPNQISQAALPVGRALQNAFRQAVTPPAGNGPPPGMGGRPPIGNGPPPGNGLPPQAMGPNPMQQSANAFMRAQQSYGDASSFQANNAAAAQASPIATYGGTTVAPANTYGGAQVAPASTYGGATVAPVSTYGGATVAPAATYGGSTIGDIERIQATQLGPARQMSSVGGVQSASGPGQIAVDQLRTRDISDYMNPYQQQVIDPVAQGIERQRLIAQEQLEGQATKANAFGSRREVERDRLAEESLRATGAALSPLYQQGFGQAMQARQFDVGQTQQARTLDSTQRMQAATLGQQAREAGAQREQAARSGNMQEANKFAQIQSQLTQQAKMANAGSFNQNQQQQAQITQQANLASMAAQNAQAQQQANLSQQAGLAAAQARNAAAQQQAQLTQQAGLSAAQAQNAVGSQQAGLTQQANLSGVAAQNAVGQQQAQLTQGTGLANQGALNQGIQAQAARQQQANMASNANQFSAANVRAGGASGLAGVGGQLFGVGQNIQAANARTGAGQEAIMQNLINQGQAGAAQYAGAPAQGLNTMVGTLTGSGAPGLTGQSTQFNPGLFNYFQTGAQMF